MRKVRVVDVLLVNAVQLFRAASKLKTNLISHLNRNVQEEEEHDYYYLCMMKAVRMIQFSIFFIISLAVICIQIPLMYLIFISKIFYTSFILWRGLRFDVR